MKYLIMLFFVAIGFSLVSCGEIVQSSSDVKYDTIFITDTVYTGGDYSGLLDSYNGSNASFLNSDVIRVSFNSKVVRIINTTDNTIYDSVVVEFDYTYSTPKIVTSYWAYGRPVH